MSLIPSRERGKVYARTDGRRSWKLVKQARKKPGSSAVPYLNGRPLVNPPMGEALANGRASYRLPLLAGTPVPSVLAVVRMHAEPGADRPILLLEVVAAVPSA